MPEQAQCGTRPRHARPVPVKLRAMKKRRDPSASLEREVILAVVILYLLICTVMLGLHYLEPGGAATATSSTSSSKDAAR